MKTEPEKILCIGGPLAGEKIDERGTAVFEVDDFIYEKTHMGGVDVYTDYTAKSGEIFQALYYGYEQHCKAVAERNKVDFGSQAEKWKAIMEFIETYGSKKKAELDKAEDDLKAIQDHYTASFLRSCRTCIIPSPFGESTPLTLSYGKCYKGYLNEAMEFIVYAGTVNGEPEKSMGRISNPICIVP